MPYIPSFDELLTAYPEIARCERAKNERPNKNTVANVITGVTNICKITGLKGSCKITALDRRKIDRYLATAAERGHTITTALTYISHLRALTARWTLPYYEDRKWTIPPFAIPICHRKPPRYLRPDRMVLLKVKKWYQALYTRPDKRDWLAVTLMLEFAMRNGDVSRLKWSDFRARPLPAKKGTLQHILCYTPRKTELTSGRIVAWPVHPKLWALIAAARRLEEGSDLVVPAARKVFTRLNRELREARLFNGVKGTYELRKICIDHIYQRFGAEAASSISGDDIRTVTRYYADPSAVNIPGVRIIDLL